jgi:transcriptional repressor NrdR
VSVETLEKEAEEIIQSLHMEFRREVPSHVIGAKVMAVLHELDEVAYVRYASVYRHFQDIGEFIDEIQKLERQPRKNAGQPELFK